MSFMNRDCSSGKIGYRTFQEAEEALIENRSTYVYGPNAGPKNVYECSYCGQYHFTSKGTKNSKLETSEVKNRIKKGQEASYWEERFKKY